MVLIEGPRQAGSPSRHSLTLTFFSHNTSKSRNHSVDSLNEHRIDEMLQQMHRNENGHHVFGSNADVHSHPLSQEKLVKPEGCFPLIQYYFEKLHLRYVAPLVMLLVYSLIGAAGFYYLEHDHEQLLFKQEAAKLESLRNKTFFQLHNVMANKILNSDNFRWIFRDVLIWYEKELHGIKVPEALEWDFWGSVFYCGTVFTTIGYGNITPRTNTGRLLSIAYAIVGIPLVLAILSQLGKSLTDWVSAVWMRYCKWMRKLRLSKKRRQTSMRRATVTIPEEDVESGRLLSPEAKRKVLVNVEDEVDEEEIPESRTIPISLALAICIGYICACAGLFCIWEKRWTFFESLYFFFISLSTIGLGDVVPDHPHMLIPMFWLVIIGLSIVSMVLSVIQIRFEDMLYAMIAKRQKEIREKLAKGCADPNVEADRFYESLMRDQPWYMRKLAPHLLSGKQTAKLNDTVETIEKSVRLVNNKNCQTASETPPRRADNATDAMSESLSPPQRDCSIQWSSVMNQDSLPDVEDDFPLRSAADDADSISEATSLPTDPIGATNAQSMSIQVNPILLYDRSVMAKKDSGMLGVQTDIAQFEVAEIMLRLHDLQESAEPIPKGELVDKSMSTSAREGKRKASQHCQAKSEMVETATDMSPKESMDRSMATSERAFENFVKSKRSPSPETMDRSMATSIGEFTKLVEETIRSRPTADRGSQSNYVPMVVEKGTSTERNLISQKSMETDAWMQVMHAKSSRYCQTNFDDDGQVNSSEEDANEISIQCELPLKDFCESEVQTMLEMNDFLTDPFHPYGICPMERSDSVLSEAGSLNSVRSEENKNVKQDLIIQTDDSYLKIARRLDEYRTNKTQNLQVCATPINLKAVPEEKRASRKDQNLPSERRGYSLDPRIKRRKSSLQAQQEKYRRQKEAELLRRNSKSAQASDMIFEDPLGPSRKTSLQVRSVSQQSRSISSEEDDEHLRKKSLPTNIQRGKVSDFIAKHERGIHNPGVNSSQSLVSIIYMKDQAC
ncbi:hypothetical protein L596_024246 [Steinernema carpocapsae]|uniref:Potassium channel domain-containing protein n=1 Tax=Steinernema carpocapsae TaxID=34508 RepID=A0A4U5MG72_STECR|nr:hypothetical protein L596_024246 [Steinernema carpocapsae]